MKIENIEGCNYKTDQWFFLSVEYFDVNVHSYWYESNYKIDGIQMICNFKI